MPYRGVATDFDDWVKLGNPGWGWDDLLPYFIKASKITCIRCTMTIPTNVLLSDKQSENFTTPSPEFAKAANISWDNSIRGHDGPVQYTYADYAYPSGGQSILTASDLWSLSCQR